MPQIVEVAGYGKVEFPDGMSKAEMADALKSLPPKETEKKKVEVSEADMRKQANPFADPETVYDPVSGAPMGTGAGVGSTLLAGATGVLNPIAGALQFAGINKPAQKLAEISKTAKEIGGTPAKVAEFAGEVGSPLPIKGGNVAESLIKKTPLAGSVMARTGAQGAVQGALSPTEVTPDMSYTDMLAEKAKQAGTGAGFGAVAGKAVQAAMAPQVSDKLQMLKDMGMKYFTPGQLSSQIPIVGKGMQMFEQGLTSLPFSGSMIRHGLDVSAQDFNRAMANQVLKPLNDKVPKDIKAGNDMVDYVQTAVSDAYRGIEKKIDFRNVMNPKTNQDTVGFLRDKFTDVAQDKPIEHQRVIFDELKSALLDSLERKGRLSGEEFRIAEKNLGAKANAYMKDPKTQDIGIALRQMQDSLRNELTMQNPKVGNELRAIHDAFKRYLRVERAAAYRGAAEGVYSPQQFQSATEALAGRRGAATGKGMMMPEAQAGVDVLGKTMPSSGTAERLLTASQAGKMVGMGGAEAAVGYSAPQVLVPLALTGMLYNRPAMNLMTKLATDRPQVMKQMAGPLSTMAAKSAGVQQRPQPVVPATTPLD